MATIDFSDLPDDKSLTLSGWIKAFGAAKFAAICILILVLLCFIGFGLSPQLQNLAEYALAVVALIAIYMITRVNVLREKANARAFAAANNFTFGTIGRVRRGDLPNSVAKFYTARNVSVRYRITGSIHDNPFTLYQTYGDYNLMVIHTKTDVTILETMGSNPIAPKTKYISTEPIPGGVRVILQGNALSRTDMAAMFATAGLID